MMLQNLTPDQTDAIGGNPHAELPMDPPTIDWRANPGDWIRRHCTIPSYPTEDIAPAIARAHAALEEVVEGYKSDVGLNQDARALAILLDLAKGSLGYHVAGNSLWIRYGPIVIPTSPAGLKALRAIRTLAQESMDDVGLSIVESGTTLRELLDALETATDADGGLLERARSYTNRENPSYRIGLEFHSRAIASMPRGDNLPKSILSPDLVGFEIDDLDEFTGHCGFCMEGTIQFLQRFNIDHEASEGSFECSECGADHESGEDAEVESCDSFDLTQEMVDAIDSQGFAERLRAYVGGSDDSNSDWQSLLDSESDDDIVARAAPDENGIKYDSEVWTFAPDLESLESSDDVESTSDVLRLGGIIARIVGAHAAAGTLPPIAGTLHYMPLDYERTLRDSAKAAISLAWDPESGQLQATLGSGLILRTDAKSGDSVLALNGRTVPIEVSGTVYMTTAPYNAGGILPGILVRVNSATAEV